MILELLSSGPGIRNYTQKQRVQWVIDIVDEATRSRMMSGIRSRNTKPELIVRSSLHRAGFRFRLNDKRLAGKPDIVLTRYNAVIFVHGCFWHRHRNCQFASTPKSSVEFWQGKFDRNIERDRENCSDLTAAGWRIATVWECQIKMNNGVEVLAALARWLRSGEEEFGEH